MLIFIESGRLGNQMFQFNFVINTSGKDEIIILIGFSDFNNLFKTRRNIFFIKSNSYLYKFCQSYRPKIDFFFKKIRLFKYCEELQENEVKYKPGLFNKITYFSQSYFQSELYFNNNSKEIFNFKDEYIIESNKFFESISKHDIFYFVHIRRGDYLSYPSINFPAYIPLKWYENCIKKLKIKNPYSLFLIFSDDINYIKKELKDQDNCIFINNNPLSDFAIMSHCNGGILSASSYSWMASFLINSKNKNATLIAPKYWIGHRRKKWHPEYIQSSFLSYEEVI